MQKQGAGKFWKNSGKTGNFCEIQEFMELEVMELYFGLFGMEEVWGKFLEFE